MADAASELVARARTAAGAGQWEDAERLWSEVRRMRPRDPHALLALGVHAAMREDYRSALPLLEAACAEAPQDPAAWLMLSKVRAQLGDADGEGEALQNGLAADPYHLPCLLAKGAWLERRGLASPAAIVYRNAIRMAPASAQWPTELRSQLERARAIAQAHALSQSRHIRDRTHDAAAALTADEASRWREAVSILSGASRPFAAEANQLHIPRLPAIPFFERDRFSWAAGLEAQTHAIRQEMEHALATEREEFQPYVALPAGAPIDQWRELNHSRRWSVYHLWRHGAEIAAHTACCPLTASALMGADLAQIDGFCPNVMFSALAPRTHIPPHHGETNARVVAHLPLIVPDGCSYRVGFEQRRWRVGELLIFDDTIEHEARNDSDETRVVLIFDVWNPLLSEAERRMARAVLSASALFQAEHS
jgi:aspartate beta-hydroxylase